jgi:ABC-type cobalamin transport system permease subunit
VKISLRLSLKHDHSRLFPSCEFAMSFLLFVIQVVRRVASSGMLRRVAVVRPDVSKESSISFIRVTRIRELSFLIHRFLSS